jgi:hypothetical protein
LSWSRLPAANTAPLDDYNDGLKTVIWQLLDSGLSADQVYAERTKSFAEPDKLAPINGWKPADHRKFIRDAVAERRPGNLSEVSW